MRTPPESPLIVGVAAMVAGVFIVALAGDLITVDPATIHAPRWVIAAAGAAGNRH